MVEWMLICGISTALVFLINVYMPAVKEIKQEFINNKVDISNINGFTWSHHVIFSLVLMAGSTLFGFLILIPVMLFAATQFKERYKESRREQFLRSL